MTREEFKGRARGPKRMHPLTSPRPSRAIDLSPANVQGTSQIANLQAGVIWIVPLELHGPPYGVVSMKLYNPTNNQACLKSRKPRTAESDFSLACIPRTRR